jgi:nitroimidazol reductase NimA-like FMN-containing flavoprotein (pyridoxamine 5'-phosphate oxidase superfamily)
MSQYQPSDHLEDLHKAECLRLLEEGSLGRIGAVVRGHPVIFPVNYVAFDGAIMFYARRGGELEIAAANATVAFEIDGVDNIYHEGWSVLTIGRCIPVTDPIELDHIQGSRLSSWAGRGRDLLVRISIDEISGRRIRHHTP